MNDRDSTDSMAAVPEHLRTKSPFLSHDSVKHTSGNRTAESTSLNNKDSDAKIRSPQLALASSHHGSEGLRPDVSSFGAPLPGNKRVSLDRSHQGQTGISETGMRMTTTDQGSEFGSFGAFEKDHVRPRNPGTDPRSDKSVSSFATPSAAGTLARMKENDNEGETTVGASASTVAEARSRFVMSNCGKGCMIPVPNHRLEPAICQCPGKPGEVRMGVCPFCLHLVYLIYPYLKDLRSTANAQILVYSIRTYHTIGCELEGRGAIPRLESQL